MNLIEFTDERILNGTFKVWNGYLAGLILDPVLPYRITTKTGDKRWVIQIPILQSKNSFGVIEIWETDFRRLPYLLCRGQIIVTNNFYDADLFSNNSRYVHKRVKITHKTSNNRITYLISGHLYDKNVNFTGDDGVLIIDPTSFLGDSSSHASKPTPDGNLIDYLISLKKFYFDFVLPRKILLPETIDTFKGVKSLSEICKEFRKSRNLKEEKLEFMDIRPCLLVALYSWKEMCILELFDDSSELIQFDELPFKDAIKLSSILHYQRTGPVFYICVPLLFASNYFTLPKFQCGQLLILRNVLICCTNYDKTYPLLYPGKSKPCGARQISSKDQLAKLLTFRYYSSCN